MPDPVRPARGGNVRLIGCATGDLGNQNRRPGISSFRLKTGFLILTLALAAEAQIGYPGGGYPQGGGQYPGSPGQYPGSQRYPTGSGPSIPMPGRGKKDSKTNTKKQADQPLPSFRGSLKRLDAKSLVLVMDDFRELEFKRSDKTKFFKNGDVLKSPEFSPGDQLSVEALQAPDASLDAVNVYWEKASSAQRTAAADGTVDTWAKDAPEPASDKPDKEPIGEKATQMAPPPSRPDPGDPGPPKLQRGKPQARPSRPADDEPIVTASTALPASAGETRASTIEKEDEAPLAERQGDALIRKAQEAALEFTEGLPNYICQESIARFQSESHPVNWRAVDVVSSEVVYENGKEDYRKLAINGKAVKKGMEELSGAWSTGEFGTVLIDLFSPATAADFRPRGEARIAGVSAKVYNFEVQRENSHWVVHAAPQTYQPAYKGSVWIDPATARVLRIEMQARNFPQEFPTDTVESATDYEYVRLGGTQQFLLPVHAETLSCQRGSSLCARNVIDFRNYHKYSGESTIDFGATK